MQSGYLFDITKEAQSTHAIGSQMNETRQKVCYDLIIRKRRAGQLSLRKDLKKTTGDTSVLGRLSYGVPPTYLKREAYELGIVVRYVRTRVGVGIVLCFRVERGVVLVEHCATLETVNVAFFCVCVNSRRPQKPGLKQ